MFSSIFIITIRVERIQFLLQNELIYFQDQFDNQLKLCVSKNLKRKIFELTHDVNSHIDFSRTSDFIVVNHYMRHITRRLKKYLRHCSSYQLNVIMRHRSYEQLIFIVTKSEFVHIITIDFILALSRLKNEYDCLMFVTNKFFKRLTTIFEKIIFFA